MCGMKNCFGVSSNGRSGGLAMFWREDINLSLVSFSKNHVEMLVDEEGKEQWWLISFYGEPGLSKKDESWTLMRQLAAQFDKAWLCVGDFNEILWNYEKQGFV